MGDGVTVEHQEMAAGRWQALPLVEQMAHIGGEVERALNWRVKDRADYSQKAFERALELLDLSLDSAEDFPRLKELARVREALVDYFFDANQYGSSDKLLRDYFLHYAVAVRQRSQ